MLPGCASVAHSGSGVPGKGRNDYFRSAEGMRAAPVFGAERTRTLLAEPAASGLKPVTTTKCLKAGWSEATELLATEGEADFARRARSVRAETCDHNKVFKAGWSEATELLAIEGEADLRAEPAASGLNPVTRTKCLKAGWSEATELLRALRARPTCVPSRQRRG